MGGYNIGILFFALLTLCLYNKLWRQKRDIYDFTDRLEQNLDALLSDKEIVWEEDTKDTLDGKIGEKLERVSYVWDARRQEGRQAKERLKELISDISHQTKTPVANQKLCLEILRQEMKSERGQEYLDKMEKQVDKLDFLFQNLVKMSRLETGVIKISKEKENLVQTLSYAVAQIAPIAAKKRIELYVDSEEECYISHDRKWTEEALFNILDNAVKYTEPGGSINIFVKRQEIFTKLSIRDTGKGIAQERQAQIFTRFYREPEVHEKEGVGIGLYLAREIIELQNGYIEVRSELGKGSEFQIYLPNEL